MTRTRGGKSMKNGRLLESKARSGGWDPGRVVDAGGLRPLLRLLRIEHTLFSLPFAYVGALASGYSFDLVDAALMALAVIGLRSSSMAFNNLADAEIDALNPRTRFRPIVTGAVSRRTAWLIMVLGLVVFHLSSAALNIHAFLLSFPIAFIALSYPYAKRVHPLPHLHLGLSLGMVVLGGAVAASGDEVGSTIAVLQRVPWALVASVSLWVAGFDIVYSIQDMEFDRRMGLGSIPALLGEKRARIIAFVFHVLTLGTLLYYYLPIAFTKPIVGLGVAIAGLVLLGQHFTDDRMAFNINLAFPFTILLTQALASLL